MKFKTMFIAVLSLLGWLVCLAPAQQDPVEGKEYQMLPMEREMKWSFSQMKDGVLCAPYFFMENKKPQPEPGKYTAVYFEAQGTQSRIFELMGWDKLVVLVDDTKQIPTVAYSKKWGFSDTVPFHWVFRISKKDLKEAQACLPKPSPSK